jgi:putative transposase
MARPIRVEYAGALYHVIARGNAKQNIFLDDKDRYKFLDWLEDVVDIHNIVCHGYCLMDNHFHLLIETPDANLSTAMRDLNGNYSQGFNYRHDRSGHLFQGRYKANVIEKETYLLEVMRYVVLNPVRAGLVDHPRKWRWSSFNPTSGTANVPDWLDVDWVLGNFSDQRKSAQVEFRKFVKDGIGGRDPYEDVSNNFILGSPQFVHEVWRKTRGSEVLKDHPREQRIVGRLSLEEIFSDIQSSHERDEAIKLARIRCGYLASEIARHIGMDRSSVGKISRGNYYPSK